MAASSKLLTFGDLRGGRNSSDPPLSLADDQVVEAVNVDWWEGTLANKRNGSTVITLTSSPFTGVVSAAIRHVPGVDESASELWGFDQNNIIGRLAGGVAWATPTVVDANTGAAWEAVGVSYAGMLLLAYKSAQNRLHAWDPSISKVRRVGLATPNPPTSASIGAGALSFTRYYKIRTLDATTPGQRRSEASTVISQTIAASSGVRITRPTLPTNEDESHWSVYYADAATGPFYFALNIVSGTSTYDDTAATINTTTAEPVAGTNYPPPSAKFIVRDAARLVMAGCYETTGGFTTPSNRRVWWTPPFGASDVGDAERIPNLTGIGAGYGLDVEADITGLGGPLDGVIYVFSYRRIWALIPTNSVGAAAYQRITIRTDVGCIRHHSIRVADDETGAQCVYFLSHRGPCRIGPNGFEYLGNDIEADWALVNLDSSIPAWMEFHVEKHQLWMGLAVSGGNEPSVILCLDVRLIRFNQDQRALGGGWSKFTGDMAAARCCCLYSSTIGASNSRALVPHIGQSAGNNRIWKCDTGTSDNGTPFQAWVDTKPIAPFGLGVNLSTTDPQLVGEVSNGVTITVTPLSDFGLAVAQAGTCVLTATGAETRVQRRVEGFQASGAGVIAYRIGDAAAVSNGWTLDALAVRVNEQEPRS